MKIERKLDRFENHLDDDNFNEEDMIKIMNMQIKKMRKYGIKFDYSQFN